jgi:hypothetical protein
MWQHAGLSPPARTVSSISNTKFEDHLLSVLLNDSFNISEVTSIPGDGLFLPESQNSSCRMTKELLI